MYTNGDYIHHATSGLCRVEDVTTLEIDGVDKNRLYYRLCPVESHGSTVFSPVEKAGEKTRYAMTREEAKNLIDEMPSIKTLWITDERARERQYKEALFSMNCCDWVKIIKTVYLRKLNRQAKGQKITSMDEQYLRKTEDRLYGELSFALGKNKEDMERYIIEQIEGKEKNNPDEA